MGILTRTGDLVYTFRFLKLLVTKFEDTKAYQLGIIDIEGNKIKKPASMDEKAAYTPFHRLVFNIKKLLAKVPGGSSKLASYAAALFLIKEKFGYTENGFDHLLDKLQTHGVNLEQELSEQHQWFVTQDNMLSPGIYRLNCNDKMLNVDCNEMVNRNDRVRVEPDCYPCGQVRGIDIYKVIHLQTMQPIYCTIGELSK